MLSEEAILKWYKEAHVAKGKSVFLDQMKKFVEWLQNAEEGMIPFSKCFLLIIQDIWPSTDFSCFPKTKVLEVSSVSNTQPTS